jgi:TM2 domain-containing membrane protein YozV
MTYHPQPPEQQPGWPNGGQGGWQGQAWQPGQGQYQPSQEQYQMRPQPDLQQWQPQPYGPPMPQPVAAKSPAVSVLCSVFIPGLGSIINGNVGTGVLILILSCIAWFFSLVLIGIPFLIGFWIWGLVDAYTSAQNWNAAHGIVS